MAGWSGRVWLVVLGVRYLVVFSVQMLHLITGSCVHLRPGSFDSKRLREVAGLKADRSSNIAGGSVGMLQDVHGRRSSQKNLIQRLPEGSGVSQN